MDTKGAQTEPKNQQIEPQGATKNKEHAKFPRRVSKWSRKCYNGVPRPPKLQEKHKRISKVTIRHENRPQSLESTQEHVNTSSQPTKQGNKERHESANKQTNKQTPTYTLTSTSILTTRPLKSSSELQTQTVTPAAGCSPKAT